MRDESEKIPVTRSSMPPLEEYVEKLQHIWDTAWLTNMGDYHEELKKELKEYLSVPGLELFVNGHIALELAIQAFDLKGEVITTPYSFASTTHAIVRNGLSPVFCDINPYDFTIDCDKLEALITDRTCAIIPTHVYGNICDVERIGEIAKRRNLRVIYDAAHTFGEKLDGVGVGNFGDASMFSFHATKVFNTIEGGAVVYHSEAMADLLYKLKNFGITGKESVEYVGGNGKMNEFQSAMGLCNLRYIDREIGRRKKLADRYRELLGKAEGIRLSAVNPRITYNYAYLPVIFDGFSLNRDEIYDLLASRNIYARKYFYPCINAFDCYQDRFDEAATPVAKDIASKVLTLPIYAELSLDVVDEICGLILRKR